MDIAGKCVVITGGASGIGAALARRFHAEGARAIAVADVDEAGLARVAAETGALAVRCNVALESDIQALVARLKARLHFYSEFTRNRYMRGPAGASTGSVVQYPTPSQCGDNNIVDR